VSEKDGYRSVGEHYARGDLAAVILAALHEAGKDPDSITVQDLAPVDQLHTRGKDATLELARLAGVTPEMQVLDVGGGLGGPARTLASEIGYSVEVLDVTEEFCRAGEMLTTRTGLGDLVSFRHASALDMPHPDATFDAVWMQLDEHRQQRTSLRRDPPRTAPRRSPSAARDHGGTSHAYPLPGSMGARTRDQLPAPTGRGTRSDHRRRLR
jgi:SAM-dependent methyltransferase